jgi:hypothetical protein
MIFSMYLILFKNAMKFTEKMAIDQEQEYNNHLLDLKCMYINKNGGSL